MHAIKWPVHVCYHGGFDKFTEFCEAFTESPPIRVVHYPERGCVQPSHYDLLLTTQDKSEQLHLTLKHRDFVVVKAGPTKWYMAQVIRTDNYAKLIETKTESKFSFTPKWIKCSSVVHKYRVPGVDTRLHYTFDCIDLK